MNNFERQEEITKLCAKYTNRELAGMLLDTEGMLDMLDSILPVSVSEMLEDIDVHSKGGKI